MAGGDALWRRSGINTVSCRIGSGPVAEYTSIGAGTRQP